MGNIGEILKRTREAKGLSLQQVEDETNMRWKYLEALEEENYDVIPGQAYVRGFLRNYAAFLGIEPEDMLEQYRIDLEKSKPKQEPIDNKTSSKDKGNEAKSMNRLIGGLLLGGLIFVGGWYVWVAFISPQTNLHSADNQVKRPQTSTPTPKPSVVNPQLKTQTETKPQTQTQLQPQTKPQPQTQPQPPITAAQDVTVKLAANGGQCWLAVYADGQKIYEGFINNGEVKAFKAQNKLFIRYGNAGVVNVEHQGKNLGKAGGLGVVVNQDYLR